MGVNRKNADADRESMDTNEEKKASSDEVMREKPRSYTPRESLWTATCQIDKREALKVEESIEVEAVVIGAGLAGVLTAYMLQQKGVDTIVLESNRIGSGVTRYTTAKITSQHNLIYDRLISDFGMEKARQYAAANQRAIDFFRKFVQEKAIDCQLEEKPAYLYTLQKEKVKQLQKESEAATKLGIPNALLQSWELTAENGWGLPFIAEAALRFDRQAQYHPLKFLKAMAQGLKIYEDTRVLDMQLRGSATAPQESEKSILTTNRGAVTARHVVFACHYPFLVILPGYYFARLYQDRAYVLALAGCPQVNGLYLSIDQEGWSFRNYKDFLLLAGGSHRTGENEKGGNYQSLRTAAKEWFPESTERYAWSTQDCMPLDGVPYIGQYAADRPNWYVATGFQKWGMTSSMIAADIISSMITKRPFEIATEGVDIFSPQRFTVPVSAEELWKDVKTIGGGLLREIFSFPEEEAADIKRGHGAVVEYKGEKLGVFRDEEGRLHKVSTKCQHMGCQLAWNPEERSWDCPCHGSRFDINEDVISGPAVKPLERE